MRDHVVELISLAVAIIIGLFLVSRSSSGGGASSVPGFLGGGAGGSGNPLGSGGAPAPAPVPPVPPIPVDVPPAKAFSSFTDWLKGAWGSRTDLMQAIAQGRWADLTGQYQKELAAYNAATPGLKPAQAPSPFSSYQDWLQQAYNGSRPDLLLAIQQGRTADLAGEYAKEAWAYLQQQRSAAGAASTPAVPGPGTMPKLGVIGHPMTVARPTSPPASGARKLKVLRR